MLNKKRLSKKSLDFGDISYNNFRYDTFCAI